MSKFERLAADIRQQILNVDSDAEFDSMCPVAEPTSRDRRRANELFTGVAGWRPPWLRRNAGCATDGE